MACRAQNRKSRWVDLAKHCVSLVWIAYPLRIPCYPGYLGITHGARVRSCLLLRQPARSVVHSARTATDIHSWLDGVPDQYVWTPAMSEFLCTTTLKEKHGGGGFI
eukprot:3393387-Rhodomonas_salina.1